MFVLSGFITLLLNFNVVFAHGEMRLPSIAVGEPYVSTVITCEGSSLYLSCDTGVISVKSAKFGRQSSRICRDERSRDQLSNTACSVDVPLVAKWCNGKDECKLRSDRLVRTDPCHGTYKYFTVRYICIPAGLETSVTCEKYRSVLECDYGTLRIISANYGRTDKTTCSEGHPYYELRNTNCYSSNALAVVSKRCNWKTSCSVLASNSVFSDPCYGTYKYLYITYSCKRS